MYGKDWNAKSGFPTSSQDSTKAVPMVKLLGRIKQIMETDQLERFSHRFSSNPSSCSSDFQLLLNLTVP
ncbi:hypothetical protein Y032_0594g422 [Ancylostoma ceylanicum]|uniref:Uncharacterized protein n=1 Tax=Ancylostoma ceylanicum TaxID=53326 RepID=A0A016WMF4_9BILA|nr:hypothetical protein Y032_0594g422 [Ancylostoma ceylanicum]